MALPFAGPPCFPTMNSSTKTSTSARRGIFPDQDQAVRWLADQGIGDTERLLPGDAWDAETRTKEVAPEWAGFSFDDGFT